MPSPPSPSSSSARLPAYRATCPSASAEPSGVEAATAARWGSAGGQIVKLPVRRSTARRSRSGTSSQPSRQPVIEKYLEKELTTIASREVAHALDVAGAPA